VSLLFAAGAADFTADVSHRREPRGFIQPACEDDFPAESPGCFSEDDENGLGDLLGGVGVARVAQSDGIDLVHMTRDECGKSGLGVLLRVLPEQGLVI